MTTEKKYQQGIADGLTPKQIYLKARSDNLSDRDAMALIARLFQLSIIEAKEVSVKADEEFQSLDDYQETLYDDIKYLLEDKD